MRRVFRRRIRKALAENVPPLLQEAIFLFDKGEYRRAGEFFEQLAQTADARNGPRAPLFYLQAGRARILAGQVHLGMPYLERGLELLAQRNQLLRLRNIGTRVVAELREQGLTKQATKIETWLKSVLPSTPMSDITPSKRPSLSTRCPACGAPLKPDEVEWLDDVTAECGYCGSPLREES